MRPQKACLVMFLAALLFSLSPLPILQNNTHVATAACVRLPWQPKDKCKISKAQRQFATNSAKKEVADALETAYLNYTRAFQNGKDAARNYWFKAQKDPFNDTPYTTRYVLAVMELGALVDTYPQSVQPSRMAQFSTLYKAIQQCFPKCEIDWFAIANKG